MSDAAAKSTKSTETSPLLSSHKRVSFGSNSQASAQSPSLLILVRDAGSTVGSSSTIKSVLLHPGNESALDSVHPLHTLALGVHAMVKTVKRPSGWYGSLVSVFEDTTLGGTVKDVLQKMFDATDAYDDQGSIYVVNEDEMNEHLKTAVRHDELQSGHNGSLYPGSLWHGAFVHASKWSKWDKAEE